MSFAQIVKIGRAGLLYVDGITGIERVEAKDGTCLLIVRMGRVVKFVTDEKEQFAIKKAHEARRLFQEPLFSYLECENECCYGFSSNKTDVVACRDTPYPTLYQFLLDKHALDMANRND